MTFNPTISLGIAFCGLFAASLAQTQNRLLDPLYVRSKKVPEPWSFTETIVGTEHLRSADAAAMISKLPGTAIVRNGAQTGIVQLRGLSGDRVGVRVDGMSITPACPNHMDPPLHYASGGAGDLVEMFAGISPVSAGVARWADEDLRGEAMLSEMRPHLTDALIRGHGGMGDRMMRNQHHEAAGWRDR